MITPEAIKYLVEEKIEGSDMFIVEIKVSSGNKIVVRIDKFSGIGIDDCVEISRHIENSFDREKEDFELEVSSAGMDSPFLVLQQYQKNLGKNVEVLTEKGKKIKGILKQLNSDGIVLNIQEKKKAEGSNKKVLIDTDINLYFEGENPDTKIKTTKKVISFK